MQNQVISMAYRQPIIERLDKQTSKGIAKYGGTIDKSGHLKNGADRLEYLAEELTDGLVYIEDAKEYVKQLEDGCGFLITLVSCFVDSDKLADEAIQKINDIRQLVNG